MRLRDHIQDLLAAPDPPLQVQEFHRIYRLARIAASVSSLANTLIFGPLWAEHPLIVLPLIGSLAALLLLDSHLRPTASWASMSMMDTPVFMTMFVLMGATPAIPFVATAEAFMGFLFVRPSVAVRHTAVFTVESWIALAANLTIDIQQLSALEQIFVAMIVTVMTVAPVAWALLAAGRDITAHTASEQALLAEKDSLLAAKDRFVASISHELRTPLTTVVGLAYTLAEADGSLSREETADFLNMIVRESEDISSIVEDLLVAARAESGHLSLEIQPVRLRPEVEAAAATPSVSPEEFRIPETMVAGDPGRIRQIVRNLLANAQRYGGPHLDVFVESHNDHVAIAVRDDGPGVPPTHVDAIVEAYGRAHDRPGRPDSVGLGLAVSRQLARMMKGDIVYSRDGDWTCFELTLPACRETSHGLHPSAPVILDK